MEPRVIMHGSRTGGEYDIIGTTADLAISVKADTLEQLFATAALGLFSLIVDPSLVRPTKEREVTAEAGDLTGLLIAYLNELLFLHETEDFVISSVTVTSLTPTRLRAVAAGETIDPRRHQIQHHVKAVTYHHAAVRPIGAGWDAMVIVDV